MTFCKVFFLYSDSVIEFRLQKSIYNYYSLKFVQRHGYKSQEWFKFLFVWWKKIPHSSRAAVVPKQTFLSTSRYFFKTHCVFLELLTPLFVDLSFCNSTPHWDHTGQISILKVHLEVFVPHDKISTGWMKKYLCRYPQQSAILNPRGWLRIYNFYKFICSELPPQWTFLYFQSRVFNFSGLS